MVNVIINYSISVLVTVGDVLNWLSFLFVLDLHQQVCLISLQWKHTPIILECLPLMHSALYLLGSMDIHLFVLLFKPFTLHLAVACSDLSYSYSSMSV